VAGEFQINEEKCSLPWFAMFHARGAQGARFSIRKRAMLSYRQGGGIPLGGECLKKNLGGGGGGDRLVIGKPLLSRRQRESTVFQVPAFTPPKSTSKGMNVKC